MCIHNMNKKGLILTLMAVVTVLSSLAQGRKDLRFNEVMTTNDSSYIDQYGRHDAWVEVFNSSYGTVGMEQMFISNQPINAKDEAKKVGKKEKDYLGEYAEAHPDIIYEIPRGDVSTKVAPRTHVVFFAESFKLRLYIVNYLV